MKIPFSIDTQPAALRRNKETGQWATADENRSHFTDTFGSALARNVSFVHRARRMACVIDYDSTGEAIGKLAAVGEEAVLPKGIAVSMQVIYDTQNRAFTPVDQPHVRIDHADYLLLNPDGTSVAAWQSAKHAPKSMIRRSKGEKSWSVSDNGHVNFIKTFGAGLVEQVRFVHRADAMTCAYGYGSTGEAVGTVTKIGDAARMPGDVRRTTQVVYDPKKRLFKTESGNVIDKADYLLLVEDGTALAGWKN